ncbi:hypothetical protein PMAYCL1PPCAC_19770, partial [Pristionchus mayeri]
LGFLPRVVEEILYLASSSILGAIVISCALLLLLALLLLMHLALLAEGFAARDGFLISSRALRSLLPSL